MTISYVIDTSYLCELFRLPDYYEEEAADEIEKRFRLAIENRCRFFVPMSCIFELADHIADVRVGTERRRIGNKLLEAVKSSVTEDYPWVITPPVLKEEIVSMLEDFVSNLLPSRIGLTDSSVVSEAKRIKEKYKSYNYVGAL